MAKKSEILMPTVNTYGFPLLFALHCTLITAQNNILLYTSLNILTCLIPRRELLKSREDTRRLEAGVEREGRYQMFNASP